MFAVLGCGLGRKLVTNSLDEAIISGEFLDFDQHAGTFVIGPMQVSLLALKRNIGRLRHNDEMMDANTRTVMAKELTKLDGDDLCPVKNLNIVPILAIHDSLANVTTLSRVIHLAASGNVDALYTASLYGDSPLSHEAKELEKERPTPELVERWIQGGEGE